MERTQPFMLLMDAPAFKPGYTTCINTPEDVWSNFRRNLEELGQEVFMVISLSARNYVKAAQVVTVGLVGSTQIAQREVFRAACMANATAIILVHNHPSGDPTPSREDLKVTGDLINAGRLMGIKVHDHVMIGNDHRAANMKPFCSIRDSGLVLFES